MCLNLESCDVLWFSDLWRYRRYSERSVQEQFHKHGVHGDKLQSRDMPTSCPSDLELDRFGPEKTGIFAGEWKQEVDFPGKMYLITLS